MTLLQNILYKVPLESIQGDLNMEIPDISLDSRVLIPGAAFIAIRGVQADGHAFIDQAIRAGAGAIVCEVLPPGLVRGITYIKVSSSPEACGIMASNFFGSPSEKMKLVGVTGTNGKTTIATLLFRLYSGLGFRCGLLSTVQNQIRDQVLPASHTTPDPVSLNRLLASMLEQECTHVFLEVSSHAIHQQRIAGIRFAGGIFTNISHDHLDYHGTFDEYLRVKKSFFDHLPSSAFALTNLDDKRGPVMLQNTPARKATYSLRSPADFKGKIMESSLEGLSMLINEEEVHFMLVGEFNAYNLLAVFGAASLLGENNLEILRVLSGVQGAEGRFDRLISGLQRISGIVDYAHTPDALLHVLRTLRKLKPVPGRIITVVGCGGDRDRAKRPKMGRIAAENSDQVILTSDNPRSEDPYEIIQEMEQGVPVHLRRRVLSITDRREAIRVACNLAVKEDIILVAGKGHEKYQEIKGRKLDFDDKKILLDTFSLLGK